MASLSLSDLLAFADSDPSFLSSLQEAIVDQWSVALDLLEDDDDEVRYRASVFVSENVEVCKEEGGGRREEDGERGGGRGKEEGRRREGGEKDGKGREGKREGRPLTQLGRHPKNPLGAAPGPSPRASLICPQTSRIVPNIEISFLRLSR
jgi:hypothetical protein